jgi:hypothetical protein
MIDKFMAGHTSPTIGPEEYFGILIGLLWMVVQSSHALRPQECLPPELLSLTADTAISDAEVEVHPGHVLHSVVVVGWYKSTKHHFYHRQ